MTEKNKEERMRLYQQEMQVLSKKLAHYEISFAMFHEASGKLQEKYGLLETFKEKSDETEKGVLSGLLLHVKKVLSEAQREVDRLQADDKEFLCFEDDRGDIFYGGIAKGKRDLALELVGKTQALALSLSIE